MAQTMQRVKSSPSTQTRAQTISSFRSAVCSPRPFTSQQPRASAQFTSVQSAQGQRQVSIVSRAAPQAAPTSSSSASDKQVWYALVANAEFFFADPQNESVAEQLRERVRFFKEQNKEIDFYIVPNPTWLDTKYPAEAKQVRRPCVALVSTDKLWITFMKLRLDRVLKFDLSELSQEEVLSAGAKVEAGSMKMPSNWTAPYGAYTSGWWEVFYPNVRMPNGIV